jgi:hypothetical protein
VAYRAAEAEESSAGRYREMGRWGDKEEIETAKRNIFFIRWQVIYPQFYREAEMIICEAPLLR